MKQIFLSLCFFTASISTSYAQNHFITTWNTEAGTGQTGNTTIKLPIVSGAYDVDVNNDGDFDDVGIDMINVTPSSTNFASQTIDFATLGGAGIYTIAIRPNPTNNTAGKLRINHISSIDGTPKKLMSIDKWGTIVWASMQTAFHSCSNLTIADDAGVPNLTEVISTHGMFANATNFTGDLSGWDVSNVTDASVMFADATSFNSDLSSWDVSNAKNTRAMFRDNDDNNTSSFNSDLSSWDVSKVTNMTDMFKGAASFSSKNYNALLLGWSSLPTLQNNVAFGAPPADYCEQATRDILTGTYSWTITGDGNLISCPFITTWNTELGENQTGNATIKLPISGGAYDVDINNDGDFDDAGESGLTGTQTITLPSAGIHTITIRPSANNQANLLRINFGSDGSQPEKLISIDQWGSTIVWNSMENAFKGCSNMTISNNAGRPNLTQVTNMSYAFADAANFNSDLSTWDVSNVTNTESMFSGAAKFTSDLSSWDVSSVTSTESMFSGAAKFTSELSSWNVSSVTSTASMFEDAANFTSDLSGWDISSVTSTASMFKNATNFTSELSSWNVSNVTDMNNMFFHSVIHRNPRRSSFNSNLNTWDVSSVTDMNNMFYGTIIFDSELSSWNVSKVKDMNSMFRSFANFNADISSWDVSSVTSTASMFRGGHNFNVDIGSWNVSKVKDMSHMFTSCGKFNQDLSNWNVSSVTSMTFMFASGSLFTGDLRSWNVSNVTDMSWMFSYGDFNGNISTWDTSKVTSMFRAFEVATVFNGDISSWNVSNVADMGYAFQGAHAFASDLSNWNVSSVTSMALMFFSAGNFNSDLSRWDVSKVTTMGQMLSGAISFNSDLSSWNVSNVTSMFYMFNNATSFSSANYDALLAGWSSLPTLQTGVVFGAPPTSYCAGETGRNILTGAPHNWVISGDTGLDCPLLSLSIDVFLQGPYNTTTSKMNASLLTTGADQDINIIPVASPYEDGATVESTVFDTTTGDDAIVDWVQVSLHDPNDVNVVISSTSALLQRDGDVVALDGSSGLQIIGVAGDYKVSINHRNHIPVITDAAQSLSTTNTAIDFTNDLTIVTGGSNAMAEVATGIYALFSGDVNQNGQVQVDDYNAAIQDVGRGGYLTSDVDMNGELQVSDINFVLKTLGKGAQF